MEKKMFMCVVTTRTFDGGIEDSCRQELKAFATIEEAKAFKELRTFHEGGKFSTECTVEVHEVEL